MVPVIACLKQYPAELDTCIVVTAQHRQMLDQVLDVFGVFPDHDLDTMQPRQSLTEITVRTLARLEPVFDSESPDLVVVQGDTTTAFAGGLSAFYHQLPVAHVEAGLRTRNKYSPYPEEMNRQLVDVLADLCYAPTLTAEAALLAEGIPEARILVTGNTVIDALLMAIAREHEFTAPALRQISFGPPHQTLVVTAHRRESHGAPLEQVCLALRDLLRSREELQLVFPVHLNPSVHDTVYSILGGVRGALLINPLGYLDFVHLMKCADIIVTDSGGIQEEAPALGKPVLVTRETTERPEGIAAGTARLVGTNRYGVVEAVSRLLDDSEEYARMKHAINPYGDGHAAQRVADSVRHYLGLSLAHPASFVPMNRSSDLLPATDGNEPGAGMPHSGPVREFNPSLQ